MLVRWESDLVEMTSFWDTGINVLPSCVSVPPLGLLVNIFVFPRVEAKIMIQSPTAFPAS
jgi:hypothetical protein